MKTHIILIAGLLTLGLANVVHAANGKPNVVFILVDNVGYGDFGCYGGTIPTPRVDALAKQGIRFCNYNVESQCTPTRAAIMTGRYSVRSGCSQIPFPGQKAGLAPWEYTIAELFSDAGYATALYGKWHLGNVEGRLPTNQGFDEWWGIKNTSDEAGYSRYPLYKAMGLPTPQVWEGKKGSPSRPAGDFTIETKRFMDENIVKHSVEYIKRQAQAKKPFFLYIGFTQFHPPIAVHPDFEGKTPARGGYYADIIGELDFRTGQILDAIKEAGIEDDTIVVFSSDNATGGVIEAGGGSNGPWRGNFFTPPFEGSYRTAAIVRWPGKTPAGTVTQEMLSSADWLPTLAGCIGESRRVPTDRPIDGVDASAFLQGQSPKTGRDTVMYFGSDGELMAVKWNTVKVVFRYCEGIEKPIVKPYMPMIYDLAGDPGETANMWEVNMDQGFMLAPVLKRVGEYEQSIAKYPNVKTGEDFEGYRH